MQHQQYYNSSAVIVIVLIRAAVNHFLTVSPVFKLASTCLVSSCARWTEPHWSRWLPHHVKLHYGWLGYLLMAASCYSKEYTEQQLVVMLPPKVLELLSNSNKYPRSLPQISSAQSIWLEPIEVCIHSGNVNVYICTSSRQGAALAFIWSCASDYLANICQNIPIMFFVLHQRLRKIPSQSRYVSNVFIRGFILWKKAPAAAGNNTRGDPNNELKDAKMLRRSVELRKRVIILSSSPFHITPWRLTL